MADEQVFATKGNLINLKKSLELAQTGFELLDRKNNILIRETMAMIDEANSIQSSISVVHRRRLRRCVQGAYDRQYNARHSR